MKSNNILSFSLVCYALLTLFSCSEPSEISSAQGDRFLNNWQLFSSETLDADGARISSDEFSVEDYYSVDLPATVMAAIHRKKEYGEIFVGDNLNKIPTDRFDLPWWYRKEFTLSKKDKEDHFNLKFEGLNYKANIWLNGKQIASADTIEGCFRMFEFDITENVTADNNVLAVEVIPPEWGDLTIGFVDWNPWPPDDNMGIWRPVTLQQTGAVRIKDIFVKAEPDNETMDHASVELVCTLENLSEENISGQLNIEIEGIQISHPVNIQAGSSEKLILNEKEYDELLIKNPRIWWPNNMGDPNLYELDADFKINSITSDNYSTRFGIRKIEDYFNEQGHRAYKMNGKELLVTGGGWVDDIFLDDTDEKIENQIRYVKHMNLNTIRLEGFWGKNKKIYDYADEHGILIMIGWSCQWEWTDYCGREEDEYLAIKTEKEIREHTQAYKDQVEWLRNHPSVFLWVYGSDKLLIPELELSMNAMLADEDGTRPILNSCGGRVSEVTGKSGVKMNGPYSYVTPNYWYLDDSRGGAFGFNTETGPGLQMAPMESIQKMIPEENLWPLDSIWEFHLGRREFASFENWIDPFSSRYGMPDNVEDFAHKAQMASYEAMRGMFEAFHVNRPITTGLIQWMLNSAWPAMMWQLYDYYLMPNAAFYATKKACQDMNIVYNYKEAGIYITTREKEIKPGLQAEISIYSTDATLVYKEVVKLESHSAYSSKIHTIDPSLQLPKTYFLDLRIKDEGNLKSVNFYWLSNKEDVLDFENSKWYVTGNTSYADLTGINEMPQASLFNTMNIEIKNDTLWADVSLENNSDQIAFFNELSLKDNETNMTLLPVFWEDNYISLLPREKRSVKAYYLLENDTAKKENLKLDIKSWNIIKE